LLGVFDGRAAAPSKRTALEARAAGAFDVSAASKPIAEL